MTMACSEAPPKEMLEACIAKLHGLFSIGRVRSPNERILQAQIAIDEASELLTRAANYPKLSDLREELQTATDSAEERLGKFSKIRVK